MIIIIISIFNHKNASEFSLSIIEKHTQKSTNENAEKMNSLITKSKCKKGNFFGTQCCLCTLLILLLILFVSFICVSKKNKYFSYIYLISLSINPHNAFNLCLLFILSSQHVLVNWELFILSPFLFFLSGVRFVSDLDGILFAIQLITFGFFSSTICF